MFQLFNFEGQKAGYEDKNKILYVTIHEPFYSAGKLLGWQESQTAGLGFNQTIIDVLLKMKCHLVVKVDTAQHLYWCNYDRIKKFLDEHNCDYIISGKKLKVLSWKIFVRIENV